MNRVIWGNIHNIPRYPHIRSFLSTISLDKKTLLDAWKLKKSDDLFKIKYAIYQTKPNWSLTFNPAIILGEMEFLTMFFWGISSNGLHFIEKAIGFKHSPAVAS